MAAEQLKNRAMVADMTRSFNPKIGSLEAKAAFEASVEKSARAAAAGLVAESERRKAAADAAVHRKKMDESSKMVEETRKEIGSLWGGRRRRVTAKRFCGCVKKVKSSKKNRRSEGSSIAICTASLLWPHGKTLHSVSCRRKKSLKTQKRRITRKK